MVWTPAGESGEVTPLYRPPDRHEDIGRASCDRLVPPVVRLARRAVFMVTDPLVFRDLAYVFAAAVLGGALAWLARQPLILGYVLGGILIGPFTPGPTVSDVHTFELFAEIGVVLLMFAIGIEFSLRDLLRVRWVALLGGPLGILLSILLGLGTGRLLGWPALEGMTIGAVVSVASTMVLARLLINRGELHTLHGRVMIAVTLVEDLAVVVLTVLLPGLAHLESGRAATIGVALGKAAAILVPFAYLAAKVVPAIMTRVARTGNAELFLLVALAIGLGTAALTQAVGLSLALGAFLAGLMISESDYAHETLARLLPLRDVFVAMFFVTIGALVDPGTLLANPGLLGVMVALTVGGKFLIWTGVVWLFRYPLPTALRVGAGLTQIGEFSFILVQVARASGLVRDEVYSATLAVSLLTILINALLVRSIPAWISRATRVPDAPWPAPGADPSDHVVLCGFGRVGSAVGEALATFDVRYVVIETDPDTVASLRARGVPCLFGDAAHRDLLERAGVARATLVVITLPDIQHARLAVRAARSLNPRGVVLARAHGRADAQDLDRSGATEVVQPEVEAATALIRQALTHLALPAEDASAYLDRFHEAIETARTHPAATGTALPDVREVDIPAGGLAGQSLRQARIREQFGITVVAIIRPDGVLLNPSPDTTLRAGDRVRLFGRPEQVDAFVVHASTPP
jgi:CPA2 family monovalent cation:H+ antiporter-2